MNAPANIPAIPATIRSGCESAAELFTGRFLAKVADFEIWMVERLTSVDAPPKIDKLIGQRVSALRKAIADQPAIVRSATRVAHLLDRLQPFLDLRSRLAHARPRALAAEQSEPLYLFEVASADADHSWQDRILLSPVEFETLQKRLHRIVKELRDQTPDA